MKLPHDAGTRLWTFVSKGPGWRPLRGRGGDGCCSAWVQEQVVWLGPAGEWTGPLFRRLVFLWLSQFHDVLGAVDNVTVSVTRSIVVCICVVSGE